MTVLTDESGFPHIPETLMRELERLFPPIKPSLATMEWPDKRLWFESGKHEVVAHLRRQYDIQRARS